MSVNREIRDRVLRITRTNGAFKEDTWDHSQDEADVNALMAIIPGIMSALGKAEALPTGRAAQQARRVATRAAREAVSHIWEAPRLRCEGKKLMSGKYGHGAAWSPAALAVVLDDQGKLLSGTPWSNRLELEHVVPASTVAKVVTEMCGRGTYGQHDIAIALYSIVNHVVVAKNTRSSPQRDQPRASTLTQEAEDRLLAHYTGGPRLGESEWFEVAWSRYLDPTQRDSAGRPLAWKLDDLQTLTRALGAKTSTN